MRGFFRCDRRVTTQKHKTQFHTGPIVRLDSPTRVVDAAPARKTPALSAESAAFSSKSLPFFAQTSRFHRWIGCKQKRQWKEHHTISRAGAKTRRSTHNLSVRRTNRKQTLHFRAHASSVRRVFTTFAPAIHNRPTEPFQGST